MPKATQYGWVLRHHEEIPAIKLYDSLIAWSSEIT